MMTIGRGRLFRCLVVGIVVSSWTGVRTASAFLPAEAFRDEMPVLVSGSSFGDLEGTPIADLGLFRYEPGSGSFVPIPFQLDERVDRVFNPGTASEFVELVYDVLDEDDGLLDANDELALVFGDAGSMAPPSGLSYPPGASAQYYEIRIADPRPGAPVAERWAYLFVGAGLPVSDVQYVSWGLGPSSSVVTETMEIEYEDRWLLTGYRVRSPCGSGADLIDRVKGRAGLVPEQGETEEVWNASSFYLGGIVGPIRAIRYVRGAASGFNTIHHDVVYSRMWRRTARLRVHPINALWFYTDWLPQPGLILYTPSQPAGLPMDGDMDGPIYGSMESWNLIRGPAGGYLMFYEIPPSPLYQTIERYIRDDGSYDDAPLYPPNYGDDDDCAFGNHGVRLGTLTGSETEAILIEVGLVPLCSDEGDSTLAESLDELIRTPLLTQVESRSAPTVSVRTLTVWRDGDDIMMAWQPVSSALSYRVFGAAFPDLPQSSWSLLGEVSSTSFRDVGAIQEPNRFYTVVPVTAAGEGEW